ncbi:2,3-diaminopropionate biosynthesis protein SbnA [Actinophytocola oryzae]|nr:2,3-diaminopropionate biosynthesis protein SbnA [Actinophytocola oryzae]
MIVGEVYDLVSDDMFLRIDEFVPGSRGYLKVEGCNPAGSAKLKTAVALVEGAESAGVPFPATRLIESTSGNLGVALAMICAAKGYSLVCVTDPKANPQPVKMMRALGAEVVVVGRHDEHGGYLSSRIDYITTRLSYEPDLHWLNQYANPSGPGAHRDRTGRAILDHVPDVGHVFVAAGTTGTLMGCAAYLREHSPGTRVVAVDVEGSAIFGHPEGPRHIPGMGASLRPGILDEELVDDVVTVSEVDAVTACRELARDRGMLVGASTGAVLVAIRHRGAGITPGSTVVGVSPDLGERYLETVFDDEWVTANLRMRADDLPGKLNFGHVLQN